MRQKSKTANASDGQNQKALFFRRKRNSTGNNQNISGFHDRVKQALVEYKEKYKVTGEIVRHKSDHELIIFLNASESPTDLIQFLQSTGCSGRLDYSEDRTNKDKVKLIFSANTVADLSQWSDRMILINDAINKKLWPDLFLIVNNAFKTHKKLKSCVDNIYEYTKSKVAAPEMDNLEKAYKDFCNSLTSEDQQSQTTQQAQPNVVVIEELAKGSSPKSTLFTNPPAKKVKYEDLVHKIKDLRDNISKTQTELNKLKKIEDGQRKRILMSINKKDKEIEALQQRKNELTELTRTLSNN